MNLLPPTTHFWYHSISAGTRINLPLAHGGQNHKVAQDLIVDSGSDNQGRLMRMLPWRDGLSLAATLKDLNKGSILFGLHPDDSLCSEKLPKGIPLLKIQVAVLPKHEPKVWEDLFHAYLLNMVNSRGTVPCLTDRPDTCPWAVSYLLPGARHLEQDVIDRILENGRIAAAAAVDYAIWYTCKQK